MVFWRNEVAKKAIVAEDNGAASAAATGGGWGKRWTILRSVAQFLAAAMPVRIKRIRECRPAAADVGASCGRRPGKGYGSTDGVT